MDKRKIFERIAILIYILLSIMYIIWRIGFTLNPDQMVASAIFLMADIMMCFSSIVFVVSLWRQSKPIIPQKGSGQFSIDVFVTTYNEDCELLESTLQYCIRMDYPHKTWLLDDGNRAEMKSLAEKLEVGYIARENNTGAKAGNLNNAMQYTKGELIAVFDADFRPEKNFLTRLTDYFYEEKVAVVQVPQAYYNTDSFQHRRLSRKEIYSDQDMFMHLILPARNNWNAAYWIGTNTLLRREAIESIGGFPTDSVTEDVLASMYIHSKGWKIEYIDEPLAYGLAPTNISEYFVQRLRWAKGAFQILRLHNPLFQKGLSFMQRLFYFLSVSHFLEGIAKIVYYLFPAFFFLFGVVPLYPYAPIIMGMLIYFSVSRIILELITREQTNLIMEEIYSIIKSFIYLMALPALIFNKNIRFRVTPKNDGTTISLPGIIGPVVIFGFNLAVVVMAIFNPYMVASLGVLGWICFAWCLYMGGIAFTACYYCFEPILKKQV
ncbi:glycosyltransferase [Parabacteroides sp. OttesenSCG-928-G07]|nr:glycosyltransferase [Parabacteroides sp. OttesenSCG-928-G07]